jgi:hypothetical protein
LPTVNSFDGIKRAAVVAAGGTNSSAINVPRNVAAITIYIPTKLAQSASYKIQTLLPDQPEGTTWCDAYYLDVATPATPKQLTGITLGGSGSADATALTIFSNIFGGGTIRFVTSNAETNGTLFYVFFSGFQN